MEVGKVTLPRHFLTLRDLSPSQLHALIRRAIQLKKERFAYRPLVGRTLALLFEKPSTRTRVSFEAGMAQLGGSSMFLSPRDLQLGRGEPLGDTARVLSRMVDAVVLRTHRHETVERFAAFSAVPVINGLSDRFHPCQLLADMQTYFEHRGEIKARKVAWIGDGNNVCRSYINAALLLEFNLYVACPEGYEPEEDLLREAGDRVVLTRDPKEAVRDADLVVTDVWTSMGQEEEREARLQLFRPYQVNAQLMKLAKPSALFMHCLPAHRGEEVTEEVLEGPQSVVWDEAENRLHSQKALLEFLLLGRAA